MRSGPIAAIVALLSLVFTLPGCGGDGTATAGGEKQAASSVRTEASRAGAARPEAGASLRMGAAAKHCRAELGDFLDSSESLANILAVGLDYEQYLSSVNRVRASYADVGAERLGIVCLARVAAPAEGALNLYIAAANEWGECLTSSCETESIEAKLQRKWGRASAQLAQARAGLKDPS